MRLKVLEKLLLILFALLLMGILSAGVLQLFCHIDLLGKAAVWLQSGSWALRLVLALAALLALGLVYLCLYALIRNRKEAGKLFQQKNGNGELVISAASMETMVCKCLECHREFQMNSLQLTNCGDGVIIRLSGNMSGGISIPLTTDLIQKQVKQYVTACSGVEVKQVCLSVEESVAETTEVPFLVEAPALTPLLKSGENQGDVASSAKEDSETAEKQQETAQAEEPVVKSHIYPSKDATEEEEGADDARPLHQRLFSVQDEPCVIPEPPVAEDKTEDQNSKETED